jgi:hypothetical protein
MVKRKESQNKLTKAQQNKLTKARQEKLKKSAILADSKSLEYACPNNRSSIQANGGHWYRVCTSETLNAKKRPKCPYCKTTTKMVEYKEIEKKEEKPE